MVKSAVVTCNEKAAFPYENPYFKQNIELASWCAHVSGLT